MEAQEIFDTVAKHLFKQGCRSIEVDDEDDAACLYRGPERKMCAIGVLIPDELYTSRLEYINIAFIINNNLGIPAWMRNHMNLLQRLQQVHDKPLNWLSAHDMKEALRTVANICELSSSVLDGLAFDWEVSGTAVVKEQV